MDAIKELVENCKAANPKAQRELYEMYKSALMGLCRRYTRSIEEAEDVLQEAFIKIFTKLHQLESVDKLEMWMKKIAVHTAVNYYHHQKRHVVPKVENGELYISNQDYEIMISAMSTQDLVKIINGLPDGYRLVFNMYEVEGYSHAEIATALNISEVTSRTQLYHAKNWLKEKLKSVGVEYHERYA